MSARAIDEFVQLSEAEIARQGEGLKAALSKLALEVNSAFQNASPTGVTFITNAVATLFTLKGTAHSDLRINCLLDAANFFYVIGQPFEGINPATKAVELALGSPHKSLLRKALTIQGVMYADTGLTSKAIECYAQALELAQELRDTFGECSVWNNLGLALIYSAQYRDALSCLEHVIHLSGSNPSLARFRESALTNTALCCLHLEDFSRGLKASETAIKEAKDPHSANELVSSVLREHHYIRLLLEVNSVDKAGERCACMKTQNTTNSQNLEKEQN